MNLVTVVIPVYKTQQYLEKCIESVIGQTYKNLEIILVDDGSPDESGSMCDELKTRDSRIIVIHQENQGLSGARNTALNIMTGDAVTFVDSDDTIAPYMIEYLVEDMEKYAADIVEGQYFDVFADRVTTANRLKGIKVCTAEEALLIDLGAKGGAISACNKLYRKKIFAKHRFETGRVGEDMFAIIGSLRQADRVVIDNRPMYYYYHRNDSITAVVFNEKTLDEIKGAKINLEIVEKEFPKALPGALFRYDWSYFWVLDRILLDENWKTNEHLSIILKHIKNNLGRILKSEYFTKNRKIGAIVALISPTIYRRMVLHTWKKWN